MVLAAYNFTIRIKNLKYIRVSHMENDEKQSPNPACFWSVAHTPLGYLQELLLPTQLYDFATRLPVCGSQLSSATQPTL